VCLQFEAAPGIWLEECSMVLYLEVSGGRIEVIVESLRADWSLGMCFDSEICVFEDIGVRLVGITW
jgi:hypothetical protein